MLAGDTTASARLNGPFRFRDEIINYWLTALHSSQPVKAGRGWLQHRVVVQSIPVFFSDPIPFSLHNTCGVKPILQVK